MKTEENILPGIRKIKQSDYWIFDTLHYIWRKRTNAAVKYPYMDNYRKRMGEKGIDGRCILDKRKRYNEIMNLIFKRMGAVAKFLLNITLIAVISVVLRIIVSYYPDYDARDFDSKIFPYIITGLFFLAAFLNPEGSLCRKGNLIIGIIALVLSIIISFIVYDLEHMSWH